jgi:hypothetical protein
MCALQSHARASYRRQQPRSALISSKRAGVLLIVTALSVAILSYLLGPECMRLASSLGLRRLAAASRHQKAPALARRAQMATAAAAPKVAPLGERFALVCCLEASLPGQSRATHIAPHSNCMWASNSQ